MDKRVVEEQDGPRGGEYYFTDLDDGRRLSVSRKHGDERVWLGHPEAPDTYTHSGAVSETSVSC